MKVIDANGVRYAIGDGMVLQVLADGTPGPAVGRIDRDGAIIIDEELAARGGECWVGELLTATLPREPHSGRPAYTLPAEMVAAIRRGAPAEWRGALDVATVAKCRQAIEQLDREGHMHRSQQHQVVRSDRVAWLSLPSGGTATADDDDDDDDDDDEADEACGELSDRVCPAALRPAFELLESIGAQLEDCLGYGRLLVHRLGLVAVYDNNEVGYARHKDNWLYNQLPSSAAVAEDEVEGTGARRDQRVSDWRNFRVLTAICYLNEPDWAEADGGQLRCFEDGRVNDDEPPLLEIVPRGGTVAVFPCCHIPHEVAPARRKRYAVTLWFNSAALLRGTPEERAAAAAVAFKAQSKAQRQAQRQALRKRPHPHQPPGGEGGEDAAVAAGERFGESAGGSPPAQRTSVLAESWKADAAAALEGEAATSGFSFGF